MDYTGIIVAVVALVGTVVASVFAFKSLKASLKNNIDLALIASGQILTNATMEKYHKEVNSKMTELLRVTGEAEKAKGVKEGIEINKSENGQKEK